MFLSRFNFYVALSLIVHFFVLALYLSYKPTIQPSVTTSKTQTITLSLGMQAAMVGAKVTQTAIKQAVITPPEKVLEEERHEETPSEPMTKKEAIKTEPIEPILQESASKEVIEPPKKNKPQEEKKPEPKKEAKPQKESEPKEVTEKPDPKPIEKPQPPIDQAKLLAGAQGQGSINNTEQKTETGQAQQAIASASDQYDALVKKHLLALKTYPKRLKMKRLAGKVLIAFTLDDKGRLLAQRIIKSSGNREIDRAAKKLVLRAKPYPRSLIALEWKQKEYQITVKYDAQ